MAAYRRILLKLSGESLKGHFSKDDGTHPIDSVMLEGIAKDIAQLVAQNIQIGIVIGGGNWARGANNAQLGLSRVVADQVGMLGTLMNALVVQEVFSQQGLAVKVISSFSVPAMAESFQAGQAKRYLEKGKVVVFAGGTGHPFVSTDSAASLRALEIEADILLKATQVDGVYPADPIKFPGSVPYQHLSYQEVIQKELKVMDLAAFIQCRDYQLPIRIFNIHAPNRLVHAAHGKSVGTLIH